jgi:hypothetical protein
MELMVIRTKVDGMQGQGDRLRLAEQDLAILKAASTRTHLVWVYVWNAMNTALLAFAAWASFKH